LHKQGIDRDREKYQQKPGFGMEEETHTRFRESQNAVDAISENHRISEK
jgi:hypothetical protein